jgi:hypothetical protein
MAIVIVLLIIASIAAALLWPALGDGGEYLPNSEELRWLGSTTVDEDDRGRKVFGRASLERRGGLSVLKLRGSCYEMGYQHGALLRDEIRDGAVPFFARATENFAPFKNMNPLVRYFTAKYFDWTIFRPLLKFSPPDCLAELKGVADGSGLDFATVFRGNLLSELNMNLVKVMEKKALSGEAPLVEAQAGCTSFAAFGDATPDGKLVMGRNTDYSGGGLWDTHQTVMFYEPEDGYNFTNIGSAGLIKCNSCMNEKGLCLGGHFLFLNDVRPDGVCFTFFELEIMRKAATIDEAVAMIKNNPRAGGFAFTLADGESGEAAVVEVCAGAVGVRRAENGVVWETNMATTEEIEPVDVFHRNGIGKNPFARFERMRMLVDERAGVITPAVAASFMGDHMDMCSDSMRPVGGVISQLTNVTSAVFTPADFNFWVADGLSPVCNNTYVGFNLMRELADDAPDARPADLAPNDYVDTDDYKALRVYYEALVSFTIPPVDKKAAFEKVCEAIALHPDEAIYRRLAAKMALRRGDVEAASEHLGSALGCVQSPSELAQTHLLLGFASDLSGNRGEATQRYREALSIADAADDGILACVNRFVVADARKYSTAPFTFENAGKIEISFDSTAKYDL